MACGASHSGCILDDGSLYTWGKGRYGRLGHNDHEPQYRPKQVSFHVKLVKFDLTPIADQSIPSESPVKELLNACFGFEICRS